MSNKSKQEATAAAIGGVVAPSWLERALLADDGTRFDCEACEDSGYVWDGDSEVPCDGCGPDEED